MTEEKRKIWKDFWGAFGSTVFLILIALLLLLALAWHFGTRAALVNGSTISRLTLIQELESESGEAMLDALVTKKLIAQKASEAGIKVDEAEVDETVKTLEERIASQGSSLDAALDQQGISMEKFREQVTLQKALEKILADKVAVSDEEVKQYLESTKVSAPEGMNEAEFHAQVKEQLVSQKLGAAAEEWIAEQKKNATIPYFVPYAPEPITEDMMIQAPESSSTPTPEGAPENQPATN